MADTTPIYGLRYLELGDAPDLAAATENLATDVETELVRIDADVAAITGLTHTVGSSTATFTSTSTTFVSGATPFGVTFVAPPSGVVFITMGGYFRQSQDGGVALMSYTVRTGGTMGSGNTVGSAANANRALICGGVVETSQPIYFQASRGPIAWGSLTPGNTYNARVEVAVDNGGGIDVVYRELLVVPSV